MAKKDFKAFLKGESYSMSYLTSMLINMLAVATTVGITMQLKVDSIEGFIVFVVLFTLLDSMATLLIKRYFYAVIVQSFGLILALIGVILIFTTERLVPDIYFQSMYGLIGFSSFFLVLRLLINYAYEKSIGRKKAGE